jgi:branched-chain amino acid transport system ATP-binding protein
MNTGLKNLSIKKAKLNFFQSGDKESISQDNSLLTCHRVSRSFGALKAVNQLSFEVPEGIVFGIGGPNGAGKTTLFDLISGVQKVNNGEVIFNKQNITNQQPHKICHSGIARTFQLNAAFETMTVRENVMVGIHHGVENKEIPNLYFSRQDLLNAESALSFVGLSDIADKVVSTLTHLELKLLMIASAITTNPKLLLLDEPVGGLIPNEIEKIEKVVGRLVKEKGLTIILIEHVMRFLVGLSDEVMIMNHGEKLYQGQAEEMINDKKVIEVYLGEGTSANFQKLKKRKNNNIDEDQNLSLEEDIIDEWSEKVESAAKSLISQKKSGKIYPIDFLRLSKIIDQKKDSNKSTQVARIAESLIKAYNNSEDLSQIFEMLSRAISETNSLKNNYKKIKKPDGLNNNNNRAKLIEEAALRLIHSKDNKKNTEKDMEFLKQALIWEKKNG